MRLLCPPRGEIVVFTKGQTLFELGGCAMCHPRDKWAIGAAEKGVKQMKQFADSQIVHTALASVQALIKKPPELTGETVVSTKRVTVVSTNRCDYCVHQKMRLLCPTRGEIVVFTKRSDSSLSWVTVLCVIQEINGQLVQLRKELEQMSQSADSLIVQTALASVQAVIKKPPELFNQYEAMAALEHLVNVAKDKGDSEAKKYSIILCQCRPLVGSKALQSVLIKLVATKQ